MYRPLIFSYLLLWVDQMCAGPYFASTSVVFRLNLGIRRFLISAIGRTRTDCGTANSSASRSSKVTINDCEKNSFHEAQRFFGYRMSPFTTIFGLQCVSLTGYASFSCLTVAVFSAAEFVHLFPKHSASFGFICFLKHFLFLFWLLLSLPFFPLLVAVCLFDRNSCLSR